MRPTVSRFAAVLELEKRVILGLVEGSSGSGTTNHTAMELFAIDIQLDKDSRT
jgi:hypothetical protein